MADEGFVQAKLRSILKVVKDNLGTACFVSLVLLVVTYLVRLVFVPTSESNFILSETLALVQTILASLICACFASYILDISSYKREITKHNTSEVIEIIFSDDNFDTSLISTETLQRIAHKALRSAMDIDIGSAGDNLIKVCLDEVRDTVNGVYADLYVTREYSITENSADAVFVKEHLTYKFYSLSDEELEKKIWRSLTSGIIDSQEERFNEMVCSLRITGSDAVRAGREICSDKKSIKCNIVNGERVFESPYPPIVIPAHCNNLTLTLSREFYIPIREQKSTFDWEYPLISLIYTATFNKEGVSITPRVTDCSQCTGLRDCEQCSNGTVIFAGSGTNSIHIETRDWVGSKMGIQLKWDFS